MRPSSGRSQRRHLPTRSRPSQRPSSSYTLRSQITRMLRLRSDANGACCFFSFGRREVRPTGLEKADLGALDQCCDFGRSCAGLASARRPGRLCTDAVLCGSLCSLPDISASNSGEPRSYSYHACVYQIWNVVDASSCPIFYYTTTRVRGTGSTITYALCGRLDERDIWSTRCFDVGTAV